MRFSTGRRPRVLAAVALAAVVGLTATACGGSDSSASGGPSGSAASAPVSASVSAAASAPMTASGSASTPGAAGTSAAAAASRSAAAHSPLVVASLAVAKQSVGQVSMLHALAYNAGKDAGIPAAQIPKSAQTVRHQLLAEIQASTMLPPPAGTPAAKLVDALKKYVALAGELGQWSPASAQPLPTSYWTRVRATDAVWLKALGDLGKASGQNLTANMAPLLYIA